jgi:hypothetical protein
MTATIRQLISALLSLLLVISGQALAMSKIMDSQADTSMSDCGSMMIQQTEGVSSPVDTASNCGSVPDMGCPSPSGLSKCGVSVTFAVVPVSSIGFTGTGSQPVLSSRADLYEDPFLASATPPPENHS